MQKFEVKGHESSLLPEGNWKLVWNDEFDGTELIVDGGMSCQLYPKLLNELKRKMQE